MGRAKNEVGNVYGRLTVIKRDGSSRSGYAMWSCLCECGATISVRSGNLRSGRTKSCGCLAVELKTTHGETGSPTYTTWINMRQRCLNPNNPAYPNYGGRGITICDRWNNYQNFLDDMGEKPEGMVLDRIDNDGNYEPSNCRWTDWVTQINNRRSSTS